MTAMSSRSMLNPKVQVYNGDVAVLTYNYAGLTIDKDGKTEPSEGFGEEELEIIEWYNDMLGDWGEGWLPVNRFSTAVQAAIADWLADFRATTREDLYQLLILAESGSDDVNIPKKRTLVRLLRENTHS
jgi:hypothetical protein